MKNTSRAFGATLAVLACLAAMAALSGCGSGSGDRQLTPSGSNTLAN